MTRTRVLIARAKNPKGLFYRPGPALAERLVAELNLELVRSPDDDPHLILGTSPGSFIKAYRDVPDRSRVKKILIAFGQKSFIDPTAKGYRLRHAHCYDLADRIIVWNQTQKDILISFGVAEKKISILPLYLPNTSDDSASSLDDQLVFKSLLLSPDRPTYLIVLDPTNREQRSAARSIVRMMPFSQFISAGDFPLSKPQRTTIDEKENLSNLRIMPELREEMVSSLLKKVKAVICLDEYAVDAPLFNDFIARKIPFLSVELRFFKDTYIPNNDFIPVSLNTIKTYETIKNISTSTIPEKAFKRLKERAESNPLAPLKSLLNR